MTHKMRLALMLLAMVIVPGARAQTNAYVYGYFTAPDGTVALVNVIRTADQRTHVVTTQLFYTFCGQANMVTACQQGDGVIPNAALAGTVLYDRTKPDVMRLTVDTSTVAGFRNQLCTQGTDYNAQCLGEVTATGGLIAIVWTRTNEWANIFASTVNQYAFGKLTSAATSKLGVFSGRQTGTVLGVSAVSSAVMSTSTDSQTLQAQFKARKVAAIKGGIR